MDRRLFGYHFSALAPLRPIGRRGVARTKLETSALGQMQTSAATNNYVSSEPVSGRLIAARRCPLSQQPKDRRPVVHYNAPSSAGPNLESEVVGDELLLPSKACDLLPREVAKFQPQQCFLACIILRASQNMGPVLTQ